MYSRVALSRTLLPSTISSVVQRTKSRQLRVDELEMIKFVLLLRVLTAACKNETNHH